MTNNSETFWSDELATRLTECRKQLVIASGITPSGEIHVGNLREVLTAHAVFLSILKVWGPLRPQPSGSAKPSHSPNPSLQSDSNEPEFIFIADNMDPLRRVYPFLDSKIYESEVGKPLYKIPCPCGKHPNYANHFLQPFLASLKALGMQPKVLPANELYDRKEFAEIIIMALKGTKRIAAILHEQTGKVLADDWSPYNPLCRQCGKINSSTTTGFDEKSQTVKYRCSCGSSGEVSMIGGGKLTWRVDWPARWKLLKVSMEPFGKDHGTRGGSYDTGKLISKEIFGYEPPVPLIYEWISLKGHGDMSSSKGNVLAVHEMLEVLPADILRYFILRASPMKSLTLDPGLPLINLIDDYDQKQDASKSRAIELSQVSGFESLGVPFRHLVTLVQIFGLKEQEVALRLRESGYNVKNIKLLKERLQFAQSWLKRFAPEEVKFALQEKLPPAVTGLSAIQKQALHKIADQLRVGMNAESAHQAVYSVKEELKLTPQQTFEAIYLALLGKKSGPRIGMFLSLLDIAWVQSRLRAV